MSQSGPPTDHAGTVVVTSTGRVAVQPDVADLRLGVSISRETVAEARSESATTMTAVLGAIRAAGVRDLDIRTSMLGLQPRYEYREGKPPHLVGYELSTTVEITVRDLARVGDVIDGSLHAGATSLDGLSFRLDDPTEPDRAARVAAVTAARARAEILAAAAGVGITGVVEIVEGGGPPAPLARGKADLRMMAADVVTPVEAGSTEIAVTVTVTFRTGAGAHHLPARPPLV